MSQDIASLELDACWPDGRRDRIRVSVGAPYRDPVPGAWRCPVRLDGLYAELRPIAGEDSLQALTLALGLIHRLLSDVTERGARLMHPPASALAPAEEFQLDTYFPARERRTE
jgi:hypothetical protein